MPYYQEITKTITNLIRLPHFNFLEVFTSFLLVAITALILDVASFFVLPDRFVQFAPKYRSFKIGIVFEGPFDARGGMKDYYKIVEDRGFDINENVSPFKVNMTDTTYHAWSNDFGCFDKNDLNKLKNSNSYDYIAGDSFAWGYGSYDSKWGTIYENQTGRVTAKCGVSHTGQIHQFLKFKSTVKLVKKYPKRVILSFCSNDPSNDYIHPHTTVINGYQVDLYKVKDNNLVKNDLDIVEKNISTWQENSSSTKEEPIWKYFLSNYSLITNLVNYSYKQIKKKLFIDEPTEIYSFLNDKYNFRSNYSDSIFTKNNRQALKEWIQDSRQNNYELIIILIPPKNHFQDNKFYADFHKFLNLNGVKFIDLSEEFNAIQGASSLDYYWRFDDHFNDHGNRFVGQVVSRKLIK